MRGAAALITVVAVLSAASASPHLSPESLSGEALALWERLTSGDRSVVPPIYEDAEDTPIRGLPEADLDLDLDRDLAEDVDEAFRFPELDEKQRKFAVNPAFKSFYDPSYRQLEGVSEDKLAPHSQIGNEVPEDFLSHQEGITDRHQSPKKAGLTHGDMAARHAVISRQQMEQDHIDDIYFTTIVAVSSALAVFAIVGAGFCYHRVRRNSKASEDVEYPAYGVTGPGGKETSPTSGTDRKLAQNAQMYHYQHQKQQMIAFDTANGNGTDKRNGAASDCESDDGEEGDYTVYECPGLAPAGEMEVHNPLFQDEPTPKAK